MNKKKKKLKKENKCIKHKLLWKNLICKTNSIYNK